MNPLAAVRRADQERLIGLEAMLGNAIVLAVDDDGPESQLSGRSKQRMAISERLATR